ncbi:hypothetical protein [Arthrobacter crystallopoietes]|uniref:hypothetical protein n=1 Tax=Crystallibacter crystallopoietes TaxID=37928 RepID=UPI0009454F63|nr:hypothetical protein [Arthrobacter crystallopoietes]AUI50297.1 hypothetical protein AC20117_05130 [Arthrobacter crystallopoietes]
MWTRTAFACWPLFKALTRTEFEQIGQDVVEDLKAQGVELSTLELGQLMKPVAVEIAGRFNGKTGSDSVRA